MHLTNVRIRNFRSFEDLDLHLHPGVNIIYGAPNIDKFGILDAIAIGVSGYFSGKYPDLARNIRQGDIRIVASTSANPFQAFSCAYPSEIHCEVQVDESKYPLTRTRTEYNEKAVAMWPNGVSIANVNTKPLLRFLNMPGIDTKRSVLSGLNPKKPSGCDLAYDKCLKPDLNANAIRKWLCEMEEERRAYPNAAAQYDAFKALVSSVVCNTTEASGLDLSYSTQHKDVIVSMDGECLPVSHLGSGHQVLLWLAMDLAYRAVILNSDAAESGNIEGIVLLHELDAHLHPDWQWNILDVLTKTFPNIQFIVTTDSPILLSSHKGSDMINVSKDQSVYYVPSVFGSHVDAVLRLSQKSSCVPWRLKALKDEFGCKLDNGLHDEAKRVLLQMIEEFGEDTTEVRIAQMELDMLLEDSPSEI